MLDPLDKQRRFDLISQAAEKRRQREIDALWEQRERESIARRELATLFKTDRLEN